MKKIFYISGIILVCVALLTAVNSWRQASIIKRNKSMVNRFLAEFWNKGNTKVADKLISPDFIDHSRLEKGGSDRDALKQGMLNLRGAFADFRLTLDDVVITENKVAVRMTASGIHQGTYMGIAPTGKKVAFTNIAIMRISDGKFVEHWASVDKLSLLEQLGKEIN